MEEVRGQLAVGILPDVLRHVSFLRESGRVEVRSEALHGWIDLSDGRPVHAAIRRSDGSQVHGLEALAAMLDWPHGTYAFEMRPTERIPAVEGHAASDGSPRREPPASGALDRRRGAGVAAGDSMQTGPRRILGPVDGASADAAPANATRTLTGSIEAVLEAARALGGRRNGSHADASPTRARVDPAPAAADPSSAAGGLDHHSGSHESEGAAAPREPRIRSASVLLRAPNVPPGREVRVSYAALELWRHLDGNASLATLAERLAEDVQSVRARADELLLAGIARVAPQPMYGTAFVGGLIEALNEIMGPMGEILVEDALIDHDLDPRGIPQDRIDDLTTTLTKQLRRSDWQLKLRARVARLRADTVEARAEETP